MVLVFVEHQNGVFKKAAFEAVTYGRKTADVLGVDCAALVLGAAEGAGELGIYGANRVIHLADETLNVLDSQVYTKVVASVAEQLGASVIIAMHTSSGKSLVGRLSARMGAASVSGAISIPEASDAGLKVKKNVFSGKAIATYELTSPVKIISAMGNSVQPEQVGAAVSTESLDVEIPASKIKVKEVNRITGTTPLPEAELVVSGGRGLKGPENWGVLQELADALGATTACSRPVSDADWRPHHEHVGQTGIAIRPNLYIAMGISGAIQHLAGVSSSKTIVVINKDPEAPFFKAADYGVVGDLFDVAPRLTEAIKKFKGS
ncbi:MAG: electron transfer flavoprotein subunit alpha/FixB family protein [Bacteroidota bacterium]